MEELSAGIRDLHDRVKHLDAALREHQGTTDLREKLGAAAHEEAKRTAGQLRKIALIVAAGLLIWSPAVAYGAVWGHEAVRNNCYPTWAVREQGPPVVVPVQDEPWFCSLFPGTNLQHGGH